MQLGRIPILKHVSVGRTSHESDMGDQSTKTWALGNMNTEWADVWRVQGIMTPVVCRQLTGLKGGIIWNTVAEACRVDGCHGVDGLGVQERDCGDSQVLLESTSAMWRIYVVESKMGS